MLDEMTAVIRLGLDSVTDFAASLNAGGGSADARQIGTGAMRGVQAKLASAIGSNGYYANTSEAFAAIQDAQRKLREAWAAWIQAGGRGATDRAAQFTSMSLAEPSSDSPSPPSSFLPFAIVVAGLGLAALVLMRKK